MTNLLTDELRQLYADASKHSQYQSLPAFVSTAIGYQERIDHGWRGDSLRLDYIRSIRNVAPGEQWGDFGANTGYFTLSLAKANPAARFTAIEANDNHARFVRRIADVFALRNVDVHSESVGLDELSHLPVMDVMLHLNVLHHAGHDFDTAKVPAIEDFRGYALRYLHDLRPKARELIFQIGSNWGGDKTRPLVPADADVAKLILMAGMLVGAGWHLNSIAYPERNGENIIYRAIGPDVVAALNAGVTDEAQISSSLGNLGLDTFPGEFYRRPLFHCLRDA